MDVNIKVRSDFYKLLVSKKNLLTKDNFDCFHKKEQCEVTWARRNLVLGLHSSGRLSIFVVVGKRCYMFSPSK